MADPETKPVPAKKVTLTQMKVVMQSLCYDLQPPEGGDPYAVVTQSFTKIMRDEFKAVADFLKYLEGFEPELRAAIKAKKEPR